MERFQILVEQMGKLKAQYEAERAKLKPNRRLIIDLEHRVKLHSARMDEYGSKGYMMQIDFTARSAKGDLAQFKLCLSGICETTQAAIEPIIKWNLRKLPYTFVAIKEIHIIKSGDLLEL